MFSLFGHTISAIIPAALIAIPFAVGLLVYIFRRNGTTKDNFVSTLFLLRDLPRVLPAKKRFIPPWQFWLELLAILLLILAGAGTFATSSGQHIAIVIDNSLSMTAVNELGVSRLDSARTIASTQMADADSLSRFSVFSAASSLNAISDVRIPRAAALNAIATVRPVFEQDRLASLLEGLISNGEYDGVWVYSDHPVQRLENVAQPVRSANILSPNARSQLTNLWISDATTRSVDGITSISVTINASSPVALSAIITGACFNEDGSSTNTAKIPTQNVEIGDNASRESILTPIIGRWDYCEIRVSPKDPSLRDSVELDNSAWITNGSSVHEVTLVSPLSAQELGVDKVRSLRMKVSSPGAALDGPAIYHRSLLPSEIKYPILAILPPTEKLPWGGHISTNDSTQVQVTRWLSSHPLTQYVTIPLISIPTARVIECPDTSLPFITSAKGPIACAGEQGGSRYIILGFEIFPFDGLKSPTLSVLTLNCLRWLFQDISLENRSQPLEPYLAPVGTTSAEAIAPKRERLLLDSHFQLPVTSPGVVRFSGANTSSSTLRAFNFYSPTESQIRSENLISLSAPTTRTVAQSKANVPLYEYCAVLALLILLLDLLRRLRGNLRWSVR